MSQEAVQVMIDASRVGENAHLPSAAQLDRIMAAGFQWIRIDLNMYQIRPKPDVWDWHVADRVVADAVARGLHVYATLAHLPAWAQGASGEPFNPEPWAQFVEAVASRYLGRIRYYGIDNEPNLSRLPDPDSYIERLIPAHLVLRKIDATIRVCGPEIATEGAWASWITRFADPFKGGQYLDIVTVHSYQKNGREVLKHVVGPRDLWMLLKGQQHVREVLRGCGLGEKPLWLTETGFSTDDVTEAEQASYYDQLLESLPEAGMVEKVFFFNTIDEPAREGKPPVRWGILREDLSPKPAYGVVQRYLQPGVA